MNRRSVLVGISGGVAAYKTAQVVSQLVQSGFHVQVAMSDNACQFVGEATFAALTGHPVALESFDPRYPLGAHIQLVEKTSLFCVAPATANFLAKTAQGLADDLLSTLYLSFTGPVLVAPAMNTQMWEKAAVRRNVVQLQADGVRFVGPDEGWLSCRQVGAGRMASPERIVAAIQELLPA